MALPYPGMDFTALDVLHAADLDKMVANIEYLANKTATSTISQNDFLDAASGYTILRFDVVKSGDLIVGAIECKKDSGTFSNAQFSPFTIKSGYRPTTRYETIAGFGDTQYDVTRVSSCGRITIGTNGQTFVRDYANGANSSYFLVSLCYSVG